MVDLQPLSATAGSAATASVSNNNNNENHSNHSSHHPHEDNPLSLAPSDNSSSLMGHHSIKVEQVSKPPRHLFEQKIYSVPVNILSCAQTIFIDFEKKIELLVLRLSSNFFKHLEGLHQKDNLQMYGLDLQNYVRRSIVYLLFVLYRIFNYNLNQRQTCLCELAQECYCIINIYIIESIINDEIYLWLP